MIEFELRMVNENWKAIGVIGIVDGITYTIHTDKYGSDNQYRALRHLIKLYECASEEITSDEHPVRGEFSITEQGDSIIIELYPNRKDDKKPIETTYAELEKTVTPFLAEVLSELDEMSTDEKRVEGIEHMATNYSFIRDFRETYRSLTHREI